MSEPAQIGEIVDHKVEILKNKSSDMKHGGPRKGAGRKPGIVNKNNMEMRESRKHMLSRIRQNTDKLINAQLSLAVGEQVLMVARTTGKGKERKRTHEIVTDLELIKQYLDWNEGLGAEMPGDGDNFYYLTTRPANNQAIDSLLNRAYGKATEKVEVESKGGIFRAKGLIIEVVDSANGNQEQPALAATATEQETETSMGAAEQPPDS